MRRASSAKSSPIAWCTSWTAPTNASAGITCCQYGENLGHNQIGIKRSIIWIDRQMQGEGPGGPHYDNFRDRRYKYVGIGVWKDGHDVWVAYDFWDGKTHW